MFDDIGVFLSVPDPHKYIVFGGLRTWDKLDKKLVCVCVCLCLCLCWLEGCVVIDC